MVKMQTEYEEVTDIVHLTSTNGPYDIAKLVWHRASNPGSEPAHILEIQTGESCIEEDIERRE